MSSRYDQVGVFYCEKHPELLRAVRHAISGPDALVEDACAYAWLQLLHNGQVVLDVHGFGWLYVVAIREGYRLSEGARREPALGTSPGSNVAEAVELERQLDHAARVQLVIELPARKREMVLLHAAGFSYREIARICRVTRRTVERQLLRGKRSLWRADAQRLTNQ